MEITKEILEKKYPNLYFSKDCHVAWVNRNSRDAEAVTCFVKDLDDFELDHLNDEAGKALRPEWFFCSECQKAYPRSQYGYFHFAGEYCIFCKDDDPQAYKEAMSENYD